MRRPLLALFALLALVPAASATWSIVVVNRRTGEVCIASATCIPRQDLTEWTPVILVGVGGGVTLLSDAEAERVETLDKGRALARAISGEAP